MQLVTFCGKNRIMATNIRKFLENYNLIMTDNSKYVIPSYRLFIDDLNLCVCIESFTHDYLRIEKGNVYLIRKRPSGTYSIYELTGLWGAKGHDADLLTYKALNNGIKGWNIPATREKNFKIINNKKLNSFLYWRTNEE